MKGKEVSSMGFLKKLVGGVFGGLFGGHHRSVDIPQPTVRAQELVPNTTAQAPEAPVLGQDKQKKGRKSLLIDRGYDYNATNL